MQQKWHNWTLWRMSIPVFSSWNSFDVAIIAQACGLCGGPSGRQKHTKLWKIRIEGKWFFPEFHKRKKYFEKSWPQKQKCSLLIFCGGRLFVYFSDGQACKVILLLVYAIRKLNLIPRDSFTSVQHRNINVNCQTSRQLSWHLWLHKFLMPYNIYDI